MPTLDIMTPLVSIRAKVPSAGGFVAETVSKNEETRWCLRDRSLRNWVVCRINSKSRRYGKHTVREERSCRPIKDVWAGRKKFRPEIVRTGKLPDSQPLKALTNLLTCSEAPGRD
ncbi:hypothetical protein CEXT_350731 [Caerostris extrusa]|uniref:Uncharacterized protein n=1 Tax=Caerostris extrusa TaxID=172846 RepID=A0AAV4VUV1_CAEEX|nr:hypothetical protein CEXT_350731 [Caerostris extrusa]